MKYHSHFIDKGTASVVQEECRLKTQAVVKENTSMGLVMCRNMS